MIVRTFRHPSGLTQRLAAVDLLNALTDTLSAMALAPVSVVYSDPPWNPGNEKWWRRHAGVEPPAEYTNLVDAWCRVVAACRPAHVFCEQSTNDDHRRFMLDAVARCSGWDLPLVQQWTVQYGSPRRPNVLLHWGRSGIVSDPSELHGEAMTRVVFEGLMDLTKRGTVADPCMGLGTTSRVAHRFGLNCVGTELNPIRLERTIDWLLRHGYTELP